MISCTVKQCNNDYWYGMTYFCGTWLDAGVLVGTVLGGVQSARQQSALITKPRGLEEPLAQLLGLISDTFQNQNPIAKIMSRKHTKISTRFHC